MSVDLRIGAGILSALGAGLLWGLVFVAPVLLPDYPATVLSVGRYLAFGVLALPLALLDLRAIKTLTRADWIEATKLSLVGNLIYYGFLATAIQTAGAPLPTMIIGTLPVVIAITSNLGTPQIRWQGLATPLLLIASGIALVNHDEWQHLRGLGHESAATLGLGASLAVAAVACWTWYPIRNSRWLQLRPHLRSDTWATAQGLATLPLAIADAVVLYISSVLLPGSLSMVSLPLGNLAVFEWPLGPRPLIFVAMMLAIGLLASWLGTLLWNRSSKLLPTALAGQLIVFETVAALLYAFLLRQQWPQAATWAGIALLLAGVSLAVQRFERRTAS